LHRVALESVGAYIPDSPFNSDLLHIQQVYLGNAGEFLVGHCDGRLVAMGALRRTNAYTAEIKRMRVHPDYQRRGFGQMILTELERRAVELGYSMLHLDTGVRQSAAQRLYEKNGYVLARRGKFGSVDSLFYEKQLEPNTDEEAIQIVPYDPSWAIKFEQERVLLEQTLHQWLAGSIEHVGSTAVPGLASKPVIDIMAGVESLDASRPALSVLSHIGYCYAEYRTDVMHWFCKPSPSHRTYHLHLIPSKSQLWIERLAFRDYLREHQDVAAAYASLKYELAQKYRLFREMYTAAKGPFIQDIVERALGLAQKGKDGRS
jgi:GrpB-like predicted nucleotidyltransferase (UPF0157 family)/GNAT superfamily N-acetyltransferase